MITKIDLLSRTVSPVPTPDELEELEEELEELEEKEEEEEEDVGEYLFFPAERAESRENYQQHQLTTPATESLPDTEGGTTRDLTHHLSSALNLATVTWTQDPYRAEEVSEENIPSFDIDFSKIKNPQ